MSNFRETYAKYRTNISGSTSIGVARWRILVNNQDIRNGSSSTLTIAPTFPGSTNIASSVIAPTAEGYFVLAIDATTVDVSFSYSISADVSATSSVSDLEVIGYSPDGVNITPITNGDTITGNVYISDTTRVKYIYVHVKWNDSTGSTMTNADDTLATISGDPALMDVSINFTQIA